MTLLRDAPYRLDRSHVTRASEVLTRAFQDHPLSTYIVARADRRARALTGYFRHALSVGIQHGEVHGSGEKLTAVAIWLPPHRHAMGSMVVSAARSLIPTAGAASLWRMLRYGWQVSASHRRQQWSCHWYLVTLGVVPECQGQGIGTALLHHMLVWLDAGHESSCLESAPGRPANLYRRLGYVAVEEATVPGSPASFLLMVRPAHGSAPIEHSAAKA